MKPVKGVYKAQGECSSDACEWKTNKKRCPSESDKK
jgi:hypothetical protein